MAAVHQEAKLLEAEGFPEMDMVCCQLEDVFATLTPLLSQIGDVEAMSLYL